MAVAAVLVAVVVGVGVKEDLSYTRTHKKTLARRSTIVYQPSSVGREDRGITDYTAYGGGIQLVIEYTYLVRPIQETTAYRTLGKLSTS